MRDVMDTSGPESSVRFGKFEVNLRSGELCKNGHRIRIQPQPLKVLAILLERPGELVTREELRKRLWPGELYLDFEHGLNRSINKLRRALLDEAISPTYIETLSTRGYRFIAPIDRLDAAPDSARGPHNAEGVSNAGAAHQERLTNEHSGVSGVPARFPRKQVASTEVQLENRRSRVWFGQSSIWRFVLVLLGGLAVAALTLRLWSNVHRKSQRARVSYVETRRFVYVADYSNNSILAYTVDPSSGVLRPVASNPFRSGEHPSSLSLVAGYLYSANRGRSDEACGEGCNISGYLIESLSGGLIRLDGSPFASGKGPVTVLAHPSSKFLYVVNVITGDLYTYSRAQDGELRQLGLPIPLGRHPFNAAVSPSGRYLYVSTQDDATISAFRLSDNGVPQPIDGSPFATGLRPRAISIDPSERYLYVLNYGVNPNMDRSEACVGDYEGKKGRGCTISAYSIGPTGALSELPGSPFASDGVNPLASAIDAAGKFLFVANVTSNDVSVFAINPTTGSLLRVRGSPFPAGEGPNSLALDWSDLYLYALNGFSRDISQFSIEDDGQLTPISPRIPAGSGPGAIVALRKNGK